MAERRTDKSDVKTPASDNSRIRRIVAAILVVVFALGYIAVIVFYRTGFDQTFSPPTPPKGGVAVVFAPTKVDPDARSTSGDVLMFLSPELLDSSGKSKVPLRLELFPALTKNSLDYAAGQIPSPVAVTIPTPGIVQQYPIDTYQVGFSARQQPILCWAEELRSQPRHRCFSKCRAGTWPTCRSHKIPPQR